MDLIPSFSVDHTRIVPGIFISRQDTVGGGIVTTYDVRLKRPNREPVIDVAAMHSLEHLIATFLRNDPDWKDEVIYWGPMGCLTGFYLPDAQPRDGKMVREGIRGLSRGERRKTGNIRVSKGGAACYGGRKSVLRFVIRTGYRPASDSDFGACNNPESDA